MLGIRKFCSTLNSCCCNVSTFNSEVFSFSSLYLCKHTDFFLYKHSVCEAQKPLQTKHTLGILSVWRSKDQKKVCCMSRISSFCKWRKTWKNIDYSQTCWREQLKHLLHIFNVKSTQQLLQTKENLEQVKHGVAASYSEINKHSLKWTWPLKMHNSVSVVFSENTVYMYQYTVLKL